MKDVALFNFTSGEFNKGASFIKQILWYFVSSLFLRPSFIPFMGVKIFLLRLFGAKVGKRICLKPCVIIKSPWYLTVGDDCWIGEKAWIDNLDKVFIGSNVCISQGALLLTGNHDYKKASMPYRNAPIIIKDGAWIGAKSIVSPGVCVGKNAILTVGSVVTKNMDENGIYQGNPAFKIRERIIESD